MDFNARFWNRQKKITYAFATKVYPNSKNLSGFILSNKFCSTEKIKVLGNGSSNGVDTEFFKLTPEVKILSNQLRKKLDLDSKDFVFILVGRLVKEKGIEELIKAFKRLKQKHPCIKILLVGPFEPELYPLSPEAMSDIKNEQGILHVGFQEDIRPYLAISNALVFPSYREGFPKVPMEAGAIGLPSIVTDINGCNEIIEHEKNGLIIPVKDENALYDAMERLITDKTLYLRLKENARKMIVDRYEQKYFWSLLYDEYQLHLKKYKFVSQDASSKLQS